MTSPLLSLAALIISILALTMAVAGWLSLRSFNRLRQTFFTGSGGANLEHILNSLATDFRQLQNQETTLEQALLKLKKDFGFAVQKTGVVRFNPFADGGGNFSFTLALLNGHNTGVVITSMHGREQNRIYTKKIQDGKSETQLTDEEQQAIDRAIDAHHKQITL